MENKPDTTEVIALYDCRSKQEYIYRTNRIKEISGGSMLLSQLFSGYFSTRRDIDSSWKTASEIASSDFLKRFRDSGKTAKILYEGGGNLFIIFKDKQAYIDTNRELSRYVIERSYTVSIIASCTDVTGDFVEDRKKLYIENARKKNQGLYLSPCNVLPFTQVDRLTHMPIVYKSEHHSLSRESRLKMLCYEHNKPSESTVENELDKLTRKGEDSLLAVIYIDGNNMGQKVKAITENKSDYAEGINALHKFSLQTNRDFVERPVAAIESFLSEQYAKADNEHRSQYKYRRVIAGGDEITIICSAHIAKKIVDIYFETLKAEGGDKPNTSCAGIAVFHSHSPFAVAYDIAEQCCESAKKLAHKNYGTTADLNYIDFHFCHGGVTNEVEALRKEQSILTEPYEFSGSWQDFNCLAVRMRPIGRANIKNLGSAIFRSDADYAQELLRIRSRYPAFDISRSDSSAADSKRMIADIANVYDIWFAGGDEE